MRVMCRASRALCSTRAGGWDKNSATGKHSSSALTQSVAIDGLADSFMAFNTNYHDTGLFGVYGGWCCLLWLACTVGAACCREGPACAWCARVQAHSCEPLETGAWCHDHPCQSWGVSGRVSGTVHQFQEVYTCGRGGVRLEPSCSRRAGWGGVSAECVLPRQTACWTHFARAKTRPAETPLHPALLMQEGSAPFPRAPAVRASPHAPLPSPASARAPAHAPVLRMCVCPKLQCKPMGPHWRRAHALCTARGRTQA